MMKLRSLSVLAMAALLPAFAFFGSCNKPNVVRTPIRIGWQTTWATQAQMAMVLKHTNVLDLNGLQGDFKPFSYGGPLAEAALGDQIDVLFAADQPAINLIARGAKWKIISKCVYFRDALLTPPESPIRSVADLRGRKIAVPFGSGAHRIVIELVKAANLDPSKDVTLVNVDATEINSTVQAGVIDPQKSRWKGDISAVGIWDPNIALYEGEKLAKVLVEKPLFGVTAMSQKFIDSNRTGAISLIKALHEALYYYAKHQQEANTWYAQETNMNFDPKVLDRAASFDRNLTAPSPTNIDLTFSDIDISVLQASSDFAFGAGLITTHPTTREVVDTDLIKLAVEQLKNSKSELTPIQLR